MKATLLVSLVFSEDRQHLIFLALPVTALPLVLLATHRVRDHVTNAEI